MKNRIFKNITVLSTVAAMSLSFTAPAFADDAEDASAAPEGEVQAVVVPGPAVETPAEQAGDTEAGLVLYAVEDFAEPELQLHTAPGEGEEDQTQAEEGTPAPEEEPAEQREEAAVMLAAGEGQAAEQKVTVGGEVLGTENNASNWTGTSGWHYTGGDVDTVTLVNCSTVPDLIAEGAGFNITAAGLNHIGTLYADADVNITGSGILLIDAIDMLQGTQLNLLTNTEMYSDGSAAVFLKNAEDGCYYLINGSVPGVLDEEYELPAGIHLVVPANTSLDLRVVDKVTVTTVDEEGNVSVDSHYGVQPGDKFSSSGMVYNPAESKLEISFPALTVTESSTLTVAEGGTINMGTTGAGSVTAAFISDTAKLIVNGILELFGNIFGVQTSNLIPEVDIEAGGVITGTGVISQADVEYRAADGTDENFVDANVVNLGDDSRLIVDHTGPSLVTLVEGNAVVRYIDGAVLNDLVLPETATEDSSLILIPRNQFSQLTIAGDISGDLNTIATTLMTVFNGENELILEPGKIEGLLNSRTVSEEDQTVTVTSSEIFYDFGVCNIGLGMTSAGGKYGGVIEQEIRPVSTATLTLNSNENYGYEQLCACYDLEPSVTTAFRVYLSDETGTRVVFLTKDSDTDLTVPAGSVIGIDYLDVMMFAGVEPGDASISVSGSNTGAGILGGENAGVLTGGGATPVLPGSRTPQPAVPEDPQPTTPENPQPAAPNDPQPKPAAVNPGQRVRISGTGTSLHAEVLVNGASVTQLSGPVSVSFKTAVPAGWNKNTLFAVFQAPDGSLSVVKLSYNASTGSFTMLLPCTGDFQIISLDWAGTDYTSDAFLAAVQAALGR